MELKPFELNETIKYVVKNPATNEDTDFIIEIYGIDTTHYKKALIEVSMLGDTDKESHKILYSKVTKGWEGIEEDGKEVPFSVKNAETIYKKYPWLSDQIDKALYDRTLFFKSSGTKH